MIVSVDVGEIKVKVSDQTLDKLIEYLTLVRRADCGDKYAFQFKEIQDVLFVPCFEMTLAETRDNKNILQNGEDNGHA